MFKSETRRREQGDDQIFVNNEEGYPAHYCACPGIMYGKTAYLMSPISSKHRPYIVILKNK